MPKHFMFMKTNSINVPGFPFHKIADDLLHILVQFQFSCKIHVLYYVGHILGDQCVIVELNQNFEIHFPLNGKKDIYLETTFLHCFKPW